MLTRGIALFIAAVLLWTGLSTTEAPRFAASIDQRFAACPVGGVDSAGHGSVEHHHLDDLSIHAHNDLPPEPHDMGLTARTAEGFKAQVAAPGESAAVVLKAVFLAELLRPPCSAELLA